MRTPSSRIRRAVLVLALCQASVAARAWGDEGHEIVATIAFGRLTAAARKAVDALLAADKDPLTARDFVSRSTWADRWRDADRNGAKKQYLATRQWHFVDIEIDGGSLAAACGQHPPLPAGTLAMAGPAKACVVDKIEQFAAELALSSTPKKERQKALEFLIHFVGDVHQPLHCADHGDAGGNQVPVLFGARKTPDSLHAYWDRHLVEKLGRNPTTAAVALNKTIGKAQAARWAAGTPRDWAQECFAKAKAVAYNFNGEAPFVDDHGGAGEHLDAAYDARALPVVKEQLAKAGVRLAALLNATLR